MNRLRVRIQGAPIKQVPVVSPEEDLEPKQRGERAEEVISTHRSSRWLSGTRDHHTHTIGLTHRTGLGNGHAQPRDIELFEQQ